jgi:hypothetical protein
MPQDTAVGELVRRLGHSLGSQLSLLRTASRAAGSQPKVLAVTLAAA